MDPDLTTQEITALKFIDKRRTGQDELDIRNHLRIPTLPETRTLLGEMVDAGLISQDRRIVDKTRLAFFYKMTAAGTKKLQNGISQTNK
ncbi:MAG: hypothetical protein AAB642_00470 [Patescibacteria group bacterium]